MIPKFTESSTSPCANVWERLTSVVLVALLFLHCTFVLRQSEYITPGDIEQNTSFGFLFFPQTSKHHPFKDGSPEKDTQQSDRNNGTNNKIKWCISPRGVSSGWVCTDSTLITLLGKVSNQKQCWHDMTFILWQDGKKPEKVSFETEHFISTKSGTFFLFELVFRLSVELEAPCELGRLVSSNIFN